MDTVKINPPMPEQNKCPQCGTPLPSGALAGLCPACLLKMGAAADTVTDAKSLASAHASGKIMIPLVRIWWNWQTRYFEVVVPQGVQVQILLCAPNNALKICVTMLPIHPHRSLNPP